MLAENKTGKTPGTFTVDSSDQTEGPVVILRMVLVWQRIKEYPHNLNSRIEMPSLVWLRFVAADI